MDRILVVSNGDKRIEYMAQFLMSKYDVLIINDELTLFYELTKQNFICLILPIRGVNDNLKIDNTNITLTDNYLKMLKNKKVFTGLTNDNFKNKCFEYDVELISYLTDQFAIENNYITVEGIIEFIVNNSEKAIYNSKILILGYGRLGQICANIFQKMKAVVTISARNEKDIVHAMIQDLNTINNNEIYHNIDKFDFIINTIPYKILSTEILNKIASSNILIIDVASYPYGLDHDYANKINIKTKVLPNIPGKTAPKTSGELLGKHIIINLGGGS